MSPADAAKVLDLPADASPEQLEARFNELRQKLEDKIAKAPTPGLKAKYRESLDEITTAFETLTLAADSSSLPVTSKQTSGGPASLRAAPESDPSGLRSQVSLPGDGPDKHRDGSSQQRRGFSPSRPKSGSREFALVAIIAVVILAGGGWFVMKTRAENDERAFVEAAAKAAAERQAAENQKSEAEEKARAEADFARLRTAQAELKIRWETIEREGPVAERRLAELKSDVRIADKLPAPEQAELKARFTAQEDFVGWLQPTLARHPARSLLARFDAQLSAKALSGAAATERELDEVFGKLDAELAAQRDTLLALGKPITLTSDPKGLAYELSDAYGRTYKGRTPAELNLPWGPARIIVASPGAGWARTETILTIRRDIEPVWTAHYGRTTATITSLPSGLPFELTNTAGLKRTGTTPAELKELPTGPVTLVIVRSGWSDIVRESVLEVGKPAAFAVEFLPASLSVTSEPVGAEIWDSARKLGTTPTIIQGLNAGPYRLELRLAGHFPAELTGTLAMQEAGSVHAILKRDPLAGAPHTIPDLGLELVRIEPGTFEMGSQSGENWERPVKKATITRPFMLGKYEVTQAQWQALMGNNPSHFRGSDLPVEQISWDDAMEFCRRLTDREQAAGRLPEGYVYTLPTEAEWEYACRAGTTGDYAGSLDAMGWYRGNSGDQTHPVGRKQANPWGLHDMHGNVWEWCRDWYGAYSEGSVNDPLGPSAGFERVWRGGGWSFPAHNCRSACRGWSGPGFRSMVLGFRLALCSVGSP